MKSFKFFSNNDDIKSETNVISANEYYRRRDAYAFREMYLRDRREEMQRQIRELDRINYESMLRGRHEKFMKQRRRRLSKTIKGKIILFLESFGFNFSKYH